MDEGITSELPDRFYWDHPDIVDVKWIETTSSEFQSRPMNGLVLRIKQQNRLVIKDCKGVDHVMNLSEWQLDHIKTGANEFTIFDTTGQP